MSSNTVFPKEGDGSLNAVFQKIPLSVFPSPREGVFAVPSTMSVAQAARELGKRNILCAPVYDASKSADAPWTERYLGIVDFLSLVDWMCQRCDYQQPATLEGFLTLKSAFLETPVSELAGHSRWSQFVPLDYARDTCLDALILLGKYGVHRVVAVDSPGGDLHNIITQSAVVDVLHNNLEVFPEVMNKTLEELGIVQTQLSHGVITVKLTDTFWTAFSVMSKTLTSAVAVVTEEGRLSGVVSVKDLRDRIQSDVKFAQLNQQIGKNADFIPIHFTCTKEMTLREVIHRLEHTKVHRLFLVDDHDKPVGVVSLREVIACMVKEPEESILWKYFEGAVPQK